MALRLGRGYDPSVKRKPTPQGVARAGATVPAFRQRVPQAQVRPATGRGIAGEPAVAAPSRDRFDLSGLLDGVRQRIAAARRRARTPEAVRFGGGPVSPSRSGFPLTRGARFRDVLGPAAQAGPAVDG